MTKPRYEARRMSLDEYLAFEEKSSMIQGEGTVCIAFLDTQLTLDQIYEDVTLPPLTVKEDEAWYDAEWADYAEEDA